MEKKPFSDNNFIDLLHQMVAMLQLVSESMDKEVVSPLPEGIEEKIAKLERDIALFRKKNDELLEKIALKNDEISSYIFAQASRPNRYSKLQAHLIEKAELLKREVAKKREAQQPKSPLPSKKQSQAPALPQEEPRISLSDQKDLNKTSVTRKNLFKSVGGNKNWRPL